MRIALVQTREMLELAFNSRCVKENTPIMEKLVELRAGTHRSPTQSTARLSV